jgi:hypothetical protein
LVLAAPATVTAPAVAHAAAADSATGRLALLLVPDDAMSDLALRSFQYQLAQNQDAQTRAAYARYPGLRDAVAGKLRPALAKILKRALPDLRKQIAAILAAEMSPGEIAETETFFASPTGHKVYIAVLRSMGDKPDRSEADASAAAMSAAMSSLSLKDYPVAIRFGASSAAGKMGRVNPLIAAASRAWADALIHKHEAKMRKLAARTADKFIAKAKRAKA